MVRWDRNTRFWQFNWHRIQNHRYVVLCESMVATRKLVDLNWSAGTHFELRAQYGYLFSCLTPSCLVIDVMAVSSRGLHCVWDI
jgi:hypothetical protein